MVRILPRHAAALAASVIALSVSAAVATAADGSQPGLDGVAAHQRLATSTPRVHTFPDGDEGGAAHARLGTPSASPLPPTAPPAPAAVDSTRASQGVLGTFSAVVLVLVALIAGFGVAEARRMHHPWRRHAER